MEVRVIVPSNFNEDTPEIVDNMLEGCTVILNLEGTDVELAQRIIDFSWGVCRALGADLVPLTERRSFFILALPNVNIMGALKKANDSYNISDSL